LNQRTELKVVMTIYDGSKEGDGPECILNQRVYNFLDKYCRTTIARSAWWAMHNGHEMVTRPLEEGEEVPIIGRDHR